MYVSSYNNNYPESYDDRIDEIEANIYNAVNVLDIENSLLFLKLFPSLHLHCIYCLQAQLTNLQKQHQLVLKFTQMTINYGKFCSVCAQLFLTTCLILDVADLQTIKKLQSLLKMKNSIENLHLMQKLKKTQSILRPKFATFINILQSKSIVCHKVNLIQTASECRKIIASQTIHKNQTIIFVPHSFLITLEMTKNLRTVVLITQNNIHLYSPKHCLISIFLLEQRKLKNQSQFYEYIQLLPRKLNNFPINFTKEQLQQLKGSSFFDQIMRKRKDLRTDYESIKGIDNFFCQFTFSDFCWARMVVCSRIFGIIINKVKTDALIPFADMLNHNVQKQTNWIYCDQNAGFIMRTICKISQGEEICDSYGQKCNSRFLLNYGFTIANNPSNQVLINVPLQIQDQTELHFNKQIGIRVSKCLQTKQFEELIGTFRYINLKILNDNDEYSFEKARKTCPISIENQILAWQLLKSTIMNQLAQYPTVLKEDKCLLSSNLSENVRNCVILRKGEKQILHFYCTMSKKMIRFLKTNHRTYDLKLYKSYLITLPFI